MSGPCLSSSVADHPLRPATRLSLGEPLPHQQADRPRTSPLAPLQALNSPPCSGGSHPVLIQLSLSYPKLKGKLFTCYAPVCRSHVIKSPEGSIIKIPLDLHVLTTPPAFTLSQDQTVQKRESNNPAILRLDTTNKSKYFVCYIFQRF